MKFRKPSRDLRVDQNYNFVWECVRFVESLPDEFEILGPGESAVKWPAEYSRDRLLSEADFAERTNRANEYRFSTCAQAIRALAAIAPEPKKRRVSLWEAGGRIHVWGEHDTAGYPWRKVAGPIEIDD